MIREQYTRFHYEALSIVLHSSSSEVSSVFVFLDVSTNIHPCRTRKRVDWTVLSRARPKEQLIWTPFLAVGLWV